MRSKSSIQLFSKLIYSGDNVLRTAAPISIIPCRTTFVLKRRYPVALVKKGEEDFYRRYKAKNYIYDMIEDTDMRKQRMIKVVLKDFVEGIGLKGDVVEVKKNFAYHKLLLPGLADYPTDEDIKNAAAKSKLKDENQFSSKTAPLVLKFLEKMVLSVVMNKETPWTLEPWHIKTAFRKAGVYVPEEAIKLPQKAITGPDLSLENKEFIVQVIINKKEIARVRTRLHHWSTSIHDKLPYVVYPWCETVEPIFEEDASILQQLKLPEIPKKSSKFISAN